MSSSRPLGMLLKAVLFLVLLTMVAEIWFRFVMPASEVPVPYQDPKTTMYRLDPTVEREGLYTVGRLARRAGTWQVNDAGWLSPFQYVSAAERGRPVVALFGDSYVEGFLTEVGDHVDVNLQKLLTPACDVYAFGASGWYLEQYVAVARYVEQEYQPDVLVILLGGGDVTDSIRENGVPANYWWQIDRDAAGWRERAPTSFYTMGTKAKLARESALVRYLRYNVKVELPFMKGGVVAQPAEPTGAGTSSETGRQDASQTEDQLSAARFMVEQLVAEHPGTPIIFASRGERYLTADELERAPLSGDAAAVRAACEVQPRCHFIDLRSVFSQDWATNHVRFEAVDGVHWNAYANRLVAQTLAGYIEDNGLLAAAAKAAANRALTPPAP